MTERLDAWVAERYGLPRARVRKLIAEGKVKLDGRRAPKGATVHPGQVVEVIESVVQGMLADPAAPCSVLAEFPELVFIDKPSGMPSQPLADGEIGTIANALLARYPEMADVAEDPRDAGLCQRLDRLTSGVMVAARTKATWEALRGMLRESRDIEKRYLALVAGPIAAEGRIEVPLLQVGDGVRPDQHLGRKAQTRFRVRARRGAFSLVEIELVTGVMHQARAHLAAIGAPVAGDARYGGPPLDGLQRHFLHASDLALRLGGQRFSATAPLPPELAQVRDAIFGPAGA